VKSETFIESAVTAPSPGSGLGIASCARELVEVAMSNFTPMVPVDDLPKGNGGPVLLIPGFLVGDWSMVRLRDFLTRLDYRVEFAGVAVNLGPTKGFIPQLERAVERVFDSAQRPVSLIGQSLGGVYARGLAHRHPGKICHVVTLCAPIHFPVATPLERIAKLLAPFHDPAAVELQEEVGRAPPVPVTAIYSKTDGIIDWRSCLQDEAPGYVNVEISGSHSAMGSNPNAQRAIAQALANGSAGSPPARARRGRLSDARRGR